MDPWVLKDIQEEDLTVFKSIRAVVVGLPNISLWPEEGDQGGQKSVSCHTLGRALAQFFPVTCKHGYYFTRGWEHCWLETSNGHVIDHYPWGTVGGPVLILGDRSVPGWHLYHEADLKFTHTHHFGKEVREVAKFVEETMGNLGIEAPAPVSV